MCFFYARRNQEKCARLCDCRGRPSESSNKLSQRSIFNCISMVRLYVCTICLKFLRLNMLLSFCFLYCHRNNTLCDTRSDQPTRPAESSNKLSHLNIRKRDSISILFIRILLLFFISVLLYPGGISHRRNQISCLARRDQPVKPSGSSSNLCQCNMRMRVFIYSLIVNRYSLSVIR